ncbi:hypothetical protein ES703_113727 [subsurface metagenome]
MPVKPKPLDILAFALALAVIGITAVKVYAAGSGRSALHIKAAAGQWILPLDSPRRFSVAGPLGKTVLEIKDGAVRVLSSPCKEKICIKSGAVSRPGQWIACLPNRVFIAIKGKTEKEVDAFSF